MTGDKPRLLFVDDDRVQIELGLLRLKSHFQVVGADSPRVALDLLERESFDIVLSDLLMPDMTGVELLARTRQIDPRASRVVTSAFADAVTVLPAIDAGHIHHFVAKPVSPGELWHWFIDFSPPREQLRCVLVSPDPRRVDVSLLGDDGITLRRVRTLDAVPPDQVAIVVAPDSIAAFGRALAAAGREAISVLVALDPGQVADAAGYLAAGAEDILWLPLRADELRLRCQTLTARRAAAREAERVRQEVLSQGPFAAMVGSSPVMRRVFHQMHQVAAGDVSLLLTGETGTGKELVARALHALSPRRDGPFMAVNLQAIPETLVEGELFGHEKGAFTGADAARKGWLESADGGTLFLDEIGDLAASIQVKLLRVLEQRTFERLGSRTSRRADFRLVCATHRSLEERVAEGSFREDLYYRINVVRIDLPPLRERGDDVRLLAEHFLAAFAAQYGQPDLRFSARAIQSFLNHHWPGNVRELKHVVERAVAMSQGTGVLDDDALRLRPRRNSFQKTVSRALTAGRGLREVLGDIERTILVETVELCGNNQVAAAKKLKIPRQTLQNRLRKYGL
jgi:DNA-binding NtrC family response regulator